MATTAATNLTIATLLDLTAASAHPLAPAGNDAAAFDSLLEPAAGRKPAQDALYADAPPSARQPSRREDDQPAAPRSVNEGQPPPPAGPGEDAPIEIKAAEDPQPETDEDDAARAADTLIEQSLAALSVQPGGVPSADQAADASLDAPIEEPGETGQQAAKRAAAKAPEVAAHLHSTAVTDATGDGHAADKAEGGGLDHGKQEDAGETPQAESSGGDPLSPTEEDAAMLGTLSSDKPPGSDVTSAESSRLSAGRENQEQTEQDSGAGNGSVESKVAANPSDTTKPSEQQPAPPPLAALAAGQNAANPASSSNGRPEPQSLAGPGPAGRNRLAGQVLRQAESPAPRRGITESEANRLLSRVARAFAAAQERDGEVRLRLSPPELGSLRVEIRVQDGALVAHLEAETEAARAAIVENLPALRERLAEQGVRLERFDVDLMHRQEPGTPNHSGGGQQDTPARALGLAPAARRPVEAAASSAPSIPLNTNQDGLNVIV